jgi:hypothetical protein
MLFVSKLDTKNIKIRFFNEEDGKLVWEHFVEASELDIHYQHAISFKTPAYQDEENITCNVEVSIGSSYLLAKKSSNFVFFFRFPIN